uniref:Uncharacterized protein n=1 Tax=Fagus sylvatica TaxID=28930 RepID=A0A2N9FQQ7_FAGSY
MAEPTLGKGRQEICSDEHQEHSDSIFWSAFLVRLNVWDTINLATTTFCSGRGCEFIQSLFWNSYRPSRGSREPREIIDGVVAGGVSVLPTPPLQTTPPLQIAPPLQPTPPQKPAPSRHTNPSQDLASRADEGATSRRLRLGQQNRDARRSLVYSTKSSQTQDSQELIAELRKEIQTLKQEAQGRKDNNQIPTKPRPTKRTHASQRENKDSPARSRGSKDEEFSETSSSQSESRSPTPPKIPKKSLNKGEPSRSRPPPYGGKSSPTRKHPSRRTARPGRQSAVWKALDLISSSPFSREIEKAKMPERFPVPRFEIYNGRTDPVTHIGQYHQSMALSRNNDPLMCRLFPSSLGEVAMRWFNQLGARTIHSWDQLAEAFVARFITNSRKRKEMGTLLTMKLEDNETLKDYSTRFWETYNDIETCGEEVAITTFKMGLPAEIEEDGRGAPPVQIAAQPKTTINKPAARTGNPAKNLPAPKNFVAPTFRAFETVFKEPIYKVMARIKKEPFFVRPPKMIGNPATRDANLYCSYHREKGHMTENCHLLKVHLEKLVSEGHLDQYINTDLSSKKGTGQEVQQPPLSGIPSAGIIHVIHGPVCSAVSSASYRSKMQKASHLRKSFSIPDSAHFVPVYSVNKGNQEQVISFSDSDLRDVQLPHNDPLVVTLRIGNYDVQRVLIDQGREPTVPLGKTMLLVLAGPINLQTKFIVVKASSPYNAIMGHDWLHRMKAIPSTLHQKLRFPTADGVMELNGDQVAAKQCVLVATRKKVAEELSPLDRQELLQTLVDNRDVFAWSVYDAPGVSLNLACHSLNIGPEHKPVVQKRRKLAPERATIVLEEGGVPLGVWSNPRSAVSVLALEYSDGMPERSIPASSDRSASRFGLKACSSEFPGCLPRLSSDSNRHCRSGEYIFYHIPGNVLLSSNAVRSEECRSNLSANGHQNVRAYDREDRRTTCASMHPSVRSGVGSGKFLGHVVSRRGIGANPDQIAALVNLAEPKNIKQVQRLTGMIAALGRFISRSADKCRPFFRLLSKRSRFEWGEECSAAFQAIKAYLSTPPCLSIPSPGEPLFLYLAVSDHAVSAVLVRELGQEQKPIFFVSKAMDETELRYLPLEKAALALLHAAKKLPHYFQSSTVTVLSDLPLKMLLQRSDFTGRITRWGVYLGSLGVEYKPRTAIKGQVLAKFLAEFQCDPNNPTLFIPTETQLDLEAGKWELFVDGASNSRGSGAEIVLVSPEGLVLEQAVRLKFSTSNNEAEYEAMLIGLRTAKKLGANHLQVFCDSQLVANQISGEYQAKDDRMSAYVTVARTLLSEFESTQVAQIGREHNSHADVLAKLATALETDVQRTVCIETLDQPSFQDKGGSVLSISSRSSWMDPILNYLKDNKLPEDTKEAKMVKRKAPRFWVSKEGLLYRRSFTEPYLLCVHPDKVKDFLFEIHEGICGSHTGGRSLAHRAISQGYWWPYMQADALKYVQECDKCQRFAPLIHQPARELNPLSSPWPFAQWGLDIVGPLPRAPGNKKFLIAATDYFTKWVEAEPLSNIRDVDTKRFLWKNIITRFGIPWAVISDNGTQFDSRLFKGFCSELGDRNFFSSPGYPQSNGQAEVSNKVILSGIKRKLEAAKGKWVEELPSILWTYRTTVRKSTNETPFALAFGVEAVIPLEIGMPTIRTTEFDVQTNEDSLRKDLDLVEEKRDSAMVRLAAYQHRLKREHNKNVKTRVFQVGDLVLRKVMANTRNPNEGKLGPNWEGPYKVLFQVGHGAYRLEDMEGKSVPRPWNTCNLRKYFF